MIAAATRLEPTSATVAEVPLTVELPLPLFLALLARPARRRGRPPSKYQQQRRERLRSALDRDRPRTAKELAALAGLKWDSQVRFDMAQLCREGKARRVAGSWGYLSTAAVEA